jgi:hypothetical protein
MYEKEHLDAGRRGRHNKFPMTLEKKTLGKMIVLKPKRCDGGSE